VIGRIGAVFAPNTIGASTLAALSAAPQALERAAQAVNRFPEVNHNYERDHAINLWFVVTAADDDHLARTLMAIEREADCGTLLRMPLLEEYRIDLGFDLRNGQVPQGALRKAPAFALDGRMRQLITALQQGLPLVTRPYMALGDSIGCGQHEVLDRLHALQASGVIRRFGVVVRHASLGFRANAMAVWDVPDDEVGARALQLCAEPTVTLCYRRGRAGPRWPYNLYCMLHGRSHAEVRTRLRRLSEAARLSAYPAQVLFSRRRFKQTGARYAATEPGAHV
jgi:DNA-binding Lrp family transcriptional regulator